MATKTKTELEAALDRMVHSVSELTDAELVDLHSLIERAHVHVMIERHLRARVAPAPNPLRSVT
ncbi:MAG TPA: hypothetical protein VIG24_17635 [Acidimicrobiia bacterium]